MKRIIFFFSLLFIISCQQEMKLIKNKDFVIKVPINAINFKGQMLDNALLEYSDTSLSIQIIVEKEMTNEFTPIDSARKNFVDYYLKEDAIDSSFIIKKLDRKNAYIIKTQTITLNPDFSSDQTFWLVGFYQKTPMEFYIVWVWTPRIYKSENEKIMEKIVKSFKIIQQ